MKLGKIFHCGLLCGIVGFLCEYEKEKSRGLSSHAKEEEKACPLSLGTAFTRSVSDMEQFVVLKAYSPV